MALQNQRTNGTGVRKFDSTYYSRTSIGNYNENMKVNITYSGGMIKLTICTSNGEVSENGLKNWEDQISVSITGTKANLLLNALNEYEKAIEDGTITMNQSWGIVTGMSDIQTILMFHLNKVSSTKAFSICSINKEGSVLKRFTYNFATDQDFHIYWSNFDTMKNEKKFDPDIQYRIIKDAITEFARTSNGAAGYTALDIGRYDINSIKNTVNAMAESMGIQTRSSSNFNRNSSGGGYFNNRQQNTSQSQHKSLDQIQSEYIDDDDED